MEIEYVTHASLCLRSSQLTLLTDPFYFPELDPTLAPSVRNFPPREIDVASFGRVNYLFSSHEHHDHCHPQTLAKLRDQVETVLLPAERPDLEARFREVGFSTIRLLQNRKPMVLEGGLELTCYWDDPVDTMLLAKLDGTVILHANDCWASLPTLSSIARSCPVDYAFFCSTSAQDLYPLLLPRPAEELDQLAKGREDKFFEVAIQRIDALRPRVVIPYSYTATYLSPDQVHLNGYSRLTPSTFQSRLKARRPTVECWSLEPGDVIEPQSGSVRRIREVSLWGRDLQEYLENVRRYSDSICNELPPFEYGEPDACEQAVRERLQIRLDEGVPYASFYSCLNNAVIIHVVGKSRTSSFLVNVANKTVTPWAGDREISPVPLLDIHIPASLMEIMLSGAYDPFMILYTYRVVFQPHALLKELRFSAIQEYSLYMGVILTLFMSLENKLLLAVAELDEFLGLRPFAAHRRG